MNPKVRRILNFLNEVYNLINENSNKLSLRDLLRKHHLSNTIIHTIKQQGLFIGRHGLYEWNSTIPDFNMANKVLIEEDKKRKAYNQKKVVKPIIENEIQKVEVTKQQKTISIFWGMFKFNY